MCLGGVRGYRASSGGRRAGRGAARCPAYGWPRRGWCCLGCGLWAARSACRWSWLLSPPVLSWLCGGTGEAGAAGTGPGLARASRRSPLPSCARWSVVGLDGHAGRGRALFSLAGWPRACGCARALVRALSCRRPHLSLRWCRREGEPAGDVVAAAFGCGGGAYGRFARLRARRSQAATGASSGSRRLRVRPADSTGRAPRGW